MNVGVYAKGTCWNYWGCSEEKREKCNTYQAGLGDECFIVNKFSSKGCQDVEDCYQCSWYKCSREE